MCDGMFEWKGNRKGRIGRERKEERKKGGEIYIQRK
jgi:hypothetical protein